MQEEKIQRAKTEHHKMSDKDAMVLCKAIGVLDKLILKLSLKDCILRSNYIINDTSIQFYDIGKLIEIQTDLKAVVNANKLVYNKERKDHD